MMLRIQKERFADTAIPDGDDYFREFGLTPQRLRLREARRHRHASAADESRRRNRLGRRRWAAVGDPRQVTNGVAVRMAVLETLAAPLAARSRR